MEESENQKNISPSSNLAIPANNFAIVVFSAILSCCLAFGVGAFMIDKLRKICRETTSPWKLTLSVFAAPVFAYLFLHAISFVKLVDPVISNVVADAFTFGMVAGLLWKLTALPTGKESVKLIVQQFPGKRTDVWLDSTSITLTEAKEVIARTLQVPSDRVSIESGKGKFLDDPRKSFSDLVNDSARTIDFFGFTTTTCFVSIAPEAPVDSEDNDVDKGTSLQTSNKNPFRSLLNIKGEARYGELMALTARIPNATQHFTVGPTDKFASAAPTMMNLSPMLVRLIAWNSMNAASEGGTENVSENDGDGHTLTSSPMPSPVRINWKKASATASGATLPIRNGDIVVIECEGKFMSVTRGWWMAWHCFAPRRSGAFIIDIIEKAPRLGEQIKGQIDAIKDKVLRNGAGTAANSLGGGKGGSQDDILRNGDTFRLRSLKFPGYELGITNVKLRDEYCYMGLRKMNGPHTSNDWCMEVNFNVKCNAITDLFKPK